MRAIWILIGRTVFWLAWPALYIIHKFSRRTRVVVLVGYEVLAVKGWIGDGKWILPGGGLHRGENPAQGVIRELREETGIVADINSLEEIYTGKLKSDSGLTYKAHCYGLKLPAKPPLEKQRVEVIELAWLDVNKLYQDKNTSHNIKHLIDIWNKSV